MGLLLIRFTVASAHRGIDSFSVQSGKQPWFPKSFSFSVSTAPPSPPCKRDLSFWVRPMARFISDWKCITHVEVQLLHYFVAVVDCSLEPDTDRLDREVSRDRDISMKRLPLVDVLQLQLGRVDEPCRQSGHHETIADFH